MRGRAALEYDFDLAQWVATLGNGVEGQGDTPEAAVAALRYQANKHELWPERVRARGA
jgi:hypothetical protein